MSEGTVTIANRLQYLGLRLGDLLMQALNVGCSMRLARRVGSIFYRLHGRHRDRAIANIMRSFPEMERGEAERMAKASIKHFMQFGAEVFFTTRKIQPDTWAKYLSVDGMEESLDLLLSDRPAILATGHYGNWEVLGYLLAMLGLDLSAIARPIDNPLINEWLLGVRQKRGMKIITKFGATDPMTEVMEHGGTLGFIADQDAGDKGVFVPFFGRLASSYKSIGLLAIRYDAPVICGYARRRGRPMAFEIGVSDIIYPEDWKSQADPLYYLTARYTRAIEKMVLEEPDQYLWNHRRWRSRPRHEQKGKQMASGLERQLESLPWMTDELMASCRLGV